VNGDRIKSLLEGIRGGSLTVEQGLDELSGLGALDLGHSRLDTHRGLRCGFPEVVYGAGKTPDQLAEIGARLVEAHGRLLVTRAADEGVDRLREAVPSITHHSLSSAVTVGLPEEDAGAGSVLVVSAGTADGAVAEEAALTARMLGARTEWLPDVGVAGIHRLLEESDRLRAARCLVVVAGMEGALPSVVGGLVHRPVVAVPTSVGYGAAFDGLAPLLGMLNSCAAGVTVVNIDNGFGAGYAAAMINRLGTTASESAK
jgi:NCAIR mutase (PurE)-related protein